MQKSIFFLTAITFIACFIYCSNAVKEDERNDKKNDSLKLLMNRRFSISDYNFAIRENTDFIQYNKAIYHRGDTVYMVFKNVGPFKRGVDSLNHMEMKIDVVNAINEPIIIRENILGEQGHTDLKNNIISRPYAAFNSSSDEKPGKYTMTVTIYDVVGKDSVVVYDDFFLE